jgi:integrase
LRGRRSVPPRNTPDRVHQGPNSRSASRAEARLGPFALEIRPLTAEQARSFLAATADDRLGPLYALAITTGMRQGELLGLRWRDIDLERGWLAVRHALRQGTRELAEPKTERARRTLRLGADAVSVLREQRRRQGQSTRMPLSLLLGRVAHLTAGK